MGKKKDNKEKRAMKKMSSVLVDAIEASTMSFSELAEPQQRKTIAYDSVPEKKAEGIPNKLNILRGNKRLHGVYDEDLIADVEDIFGDNVDEEKGDDAYYFTIAPPFLEKTDEEMIFSNEQPKGTIQRFKSTPHLAKRIPKWDGVELVNQKLIDRQWVKDVRGASQSLLDFKQDSEFKIGAKAQQNPAYRQSAYGVDDPVPSTKKGGSKKESDASPVSEFYMPRPSLPSYVQSGDFLFGKQAYQHYIDNKRELDQLEREEIAPRINMLRQRLVAKRDQIEEVITKAKEYYDSVYKPRKSLKERFTVVKKFLKEADYPNYGVVQKGASETDVRKRLEKVTYHTTWLIYLIIALQAISIAILCSMAGVIPPRLSPNRITADDIMTWNGLAEVEHFVVPNMWVGPKQANLIKSGALYAPCLRRDKARLLRNAVHKAQLSELGCCEAKGRGAGTTTERECVELQVMYSIQQIQWINVTCSKRSRISTDGIYVPHEFKPCCLADRGDCILATHKHCVVLGGVWHITEFEHCSQANCDGNLCQVYESSQHRNASKSTSQFWRLPLSVMFHEGIISAVIHGLIIQAYIGGGIEEMAGWYRMLAIYIICGVGGLLFGSVIVPYVPNVGSNGAICGLISILAVELVQAWPLVEKGVRLRAVAKIAVLYIIMGVSGLFPGINQFTNIAGGVLGVLCALSFMPYMPSSRLHHRVMLLLRIVSSTFLVIAVFLFFYSFYILQPNFTGSIRFLNCLSFVKYACDEDLP